MNISASTPEPFTFDQPGQWLKWARRLIRYRTVSSLEKKPERVQVGTLIYSMGDKAEGILATFNLSQEDSEKFYVVKEKFDQHKYDL